MKVPSYLKSFDLPITLDGFAGFNQRWADPWGHINNEIRESLMTPTQMIERGERDLVYRKYLSRFGLKAGTCKFQAIRVHDYSHTNVTSRDWFKEYRDCVFRVWVNPHTIYNSTYKTHYQYYVLCPEDIFLLHCLERAEKGFPYPPRRSFKHICPHAPLRKIRMIPVECCKHYRHETTGGQLPGEL